MKATPTHQFAVVEDVERRNIVQSGTLEYCQNVARAYNQAYHSTAYRARLWIERDS